jgi:hypothetical protein
MLDRTSVKIALVSVILAAAWIGTVTAAGPWTRIKWWIIGVAAFGVFNAVVSVPGTAWIRGASVAVSIFSLLFGPVGVLVLAVWLAWPPAFMVAWSLTRAADRHKDPELPAYDDEWFTPARISLAAMMIAVTISTLAYKLIFSHGLQQSSALFIGIPALIAVIVVFSVSPRSAQGVACKAVTVCLLMSMIFLGEGMICVIMSAPLFYAVAVAIASAVTWHLDNHESATLRSCAMLLPVVAMSLEGVTAVTSFNRHERVAVSRVVHSSSDEVARAVVAYPRFDRPLPRFLNIGFPTPIATNIDLTTAPPRWVITFRGGEMRLDGVEPRVGTLVLELVQSGPGFARWRAISDTSHMTHYLGWREMSLHWEPAGTDRTRVTCSVAYSRDLDPAWYFGPWQRYAMRLAADYLIDTVATP